MTYIRCRTCTITSLRPDTHFDETGQCSGCYNFARRPVINWDQRKADLLALLDRHDGRCLVPSSAGKDSLAQILMLQALGADVTAVTAETCHLTPQGAANIDNAARFVSTIRMVPNKRVRAALNRIGLRMVYDISYPEHVAIHTVPFQVAVDTKIPLLFFGEHSPTEYGGPPDVHENRRMTRRWAAEYAGYLALRIPDLEGMEGLTKRDLRDYLCPNDQELETLGVEAHFLGQYLPWDGFENGKMAAKNGLRAVLPSPSNWYIQENVDNFHTGVHDFGKFIKFGMGRGCAQVSIDIRHGRATREQGMTFVRERDGLFPRKYMGMELERILDHINMGQGEFMGLTNQFLNKSIFTQTKIGWGERPMLKEFV